MKCPNCGYWNEATANFCEDCGFELRDADRSPEPVSIKPADESEGESAIPTPPPQQLQPADDITAPNVYSGARLMLATTGSIFKLGEKTSIGRQDPRLDIDFEGYPDSQYISGTHAQIIRMNERYYIEDLGSSNHTFVNDRRVAAGQLEPLNEGDTVRFGKLTLTFHEK